MAKECRKSGGLPSAARRRVVVASLKENYDFAIWRSKRSCDIAKALGTNKIQLWLAREGTLCAEGKNPVEKILQLRDAMNTILEYDRDALILVEPKPNEPRGDILLPTIGHALGLIATLPGGSLRHTVPSPSAVLSRSAARKVDSRASASGTAQGSAR